MNLIKPSGYGTVPAQRHLTEGEHVSTAFIVILSVTVLVGLGFIALMAAAIRGHQMYQQQRNRQQEYARAHESYKRFLQSQRGQHIEHRMRSHLPPMNLHVQINPDGTMRESVNTPIAREDEPTQPQIDVVLLQPAVKM